MSSRTHLTLSHKHSLWTMCHQTRVQGLALGGQWRVLEVRHRHTALLGPSQLLGQRAAVLCARQTRVLPALSLWTAFRQGSTDGRAGDFGRKRSAFRLRLRRMQHPGSCHGRHSQDAPPPWAFTSRPPLRMPPEARGLTSEPGTAVRLARPRPSASHDTSASTTQTRP